MKITALMMLTLMVQPLCIALEAPTGNQQESAKPSEKDASKPVIMELAGGSIRLEAPKEWKQVEPRFPQMVQYEFNAPANADLAAAKPGEAPVRITVMASGGGLQGNLERWYGQFSQPDGKATKDVAKIEELDVQGPKVHLVKITGTYSGGMMPGGRPAQPKPNHQLLSGIIETSKEGTFFVTAIGPIDECEKLLDGFREMLVNLKSK